MAFSLPTCSYRLECDQQAHIQLREIANQCFKDKRFHDAIMNYNMALEICLAYPKKLVKEAAKLHNDLAKLYLEPEPRYNSPGNALEHAGACIQLDEDFHMGYYHKAAALQQLALTERQQQHEANKDAISNYLKCYETHSKQSSKIWMEPLCRAVLLAVDCGYPGMLKLNERGSTLPELLKALIKHPQSKMPHLKYLLMTIQDAQCGISSADQHVDYDKLCQRSLKAKRPQFVAYFISCGATPPVPQVFEFMNQKNPNKDLRSYIVLNSSKSERADLVSKALQKWDLEFAIELMDSGPLNSEKIDLGELLESTFLPTRPDLVEQLLKKGANPNGTPGSSRSPADVVLSLDRKRYSETDKVSLITVLVNGGAQSHNVKGTTLIHSATEFALVTGDMQILHTVCNKFAFPPDGRIENSQGQNPWHIALKFKRGETSVKVCEVLSQYSINPAPSSKYMRTGIKRPDYDRNPADKRVKLLRITEEKLQRKDEDKPKSRKSKKEKMVDSVESTEHEETTKHLPPQTQDDSYSTRNSKKQEKDESKEQLSAIPATSAQQKTSTQTKPVDYQKLPSHQKLEEQMKRVLKEDPNYFIMQIPEPSEDSQPITEEAKPPVSLQVSSTSSSTNDQSATYPQPEPSGNSSCKAVHEPPMPSQKQANEKEGDINELGAQYGYNFDDLEWEVEVTRRVFKFFNDKKKNSFEDRMSAVRTLYQLAEGKRNNYSLAKEVRYCEKDLKLYEAKMTKGGRILWEKAIQFSARRTQNPSDPVYVEVIRVWDIVPNHDQLKHCIQQIAKSHKKGTEASMCHTLSPLPHPSVATTSSVKRRETIESPRMFTSSMQESQIETTEHAQSFIPAASMKEDEYSVTTMYAFSSTMVRCVLTGKNIRQDFPFKEWPKEHEIISLQTNEAILLLGRSGTGKTTCCLYRLWNEFKNYWDPERRHPEAKIPRTVLIPEKELNEHSDTAERDQKLEESAHRPSECLQLSEANATESAATYEHKRHGSFQEPHSEVGQFGMLQPSKDLPPAAEEEDQEPVPKASVHVELPQRLDVSLSECDILTPGVPNYHHVHFQQPSLENYLQDTCFTDVQVGGSEFRESENAEAMNESASTLPLAPNDDTVNTDQTYSSDAALFTSAKTEILEDLHQVFLTKNYVLCAQMKKKFYDLAAACDFLDEHLDYETKELPNSLTKVNLLDHAFPLFLTARQFYILFDNSLDDDPFFPRDEQGNVKVKIVSSDYDHEDADTLLDLEASESEDEEEGVKLQNTPLQQTASKQYTEKYVEVTSLYFKETIWPEIVHKCDAKDIDPLLVWMEIQSFIKGSERALCKGTPLILEEYKDLGKKIAPNFSDQREQIYKAFQCYQDYFQNNRHNKNTFLFDECDLVQHIHSRLQLSLKHGDIDWSVHCLYVDEVQDFTQAELTLLLHCCRDPNSMFFTGDTAQSIMRGIAFRFQDLRSSFYRIHRKLPQVKVPQNPYTLTINFRSHSGVLSLAGSIIDLLREFFRGSIDDHLPEEKGMFPGPTPVLIESCEISDLALLLSTNKREGSVIEFGAHQVILVQSKEAKEKLPEILQGAIVLTIFEAKGLEFDDVLLYNFFTDSLVDEKGWRVITSYLKNNPEMISNPKPLPGADREPHGVTFDEKCHKSLNPELKYLYTATTRAKCNLWIYDQDKKKRLPVFHYWFKRGIAMVIGTKQDRQEEHGLLFASNSTNEQWKTQGDNFMKRHMWEPAKHCYERAGPENAYLAKEAHAHLLVKRSKHSIKPQLYFEAALCFLECDEQSHDVKYVSNAAVCLMNSQHPRRIMIHAAKLFERLEQDTRAIKAYKKAQDIENCARLLEKIGHYNEAVRILDHFNKKKEALAKAAGFESRGIQLEPELTVNELYYTYAKQYANQKNKNMLLEVLRYARDVPRKARILKEGDLFEEAYSAHVQQKQYEDAYRLASAQCWHDKGISLANQQTDDKMKAVFTFQKIKAQCRAQLISKLVTTGKQLQSKRRTIPQKYLNSLNILKGSEDKHTSAQALLLLAILTEEVGPCITARGIYRLLKHKVGELEAFNVKAQLKDPNEAIRTILDACHLAQEVIAVLEADAGKIFSVSPTVVEAADFYGFRRVGDVYYIPPLQDIWIGDSLKKCECPDKKDLDGMLSLDVRKTRQAIAQHFRSYVTCWVKRFKMEEKLQQKLSEFKFHREISECKFLSHVWIMHGRNLLTYVNSCLDCLEFGLGIKNDKLTHKTGSLLLSLFSPEVSFCLPLSKMHISAVRNRRFHGIFTDWIEANIQMSEKIEANTWLNAWRMCCIIGGSTKILEDAVVERAKKVNNEAKDFKNCPPKGDTDANVQTRKPTEGNFRAPSEFVLWRNENNYYHVFHFWLQSCKLMGSGQALEALKSAVYHFLGNIAESEGALRFISAMNVVEILSIQSTAAFAILTHLNVSQRQQFAFQVPLTYKHAVQLFDDLNGNRKWVLAACSEEVQHALTKYNLEDLKIKCRRLLWCSLDMLLAMKKYRHFTILQTALREKGIVGQQCLILALTLFGNLAQFTPTKQQYDYKKALSAALEASMKSKNVPHYIQEVQRLSLSPDFHNHVFHFVERLLLKINPQEKATLAKLVLSRKTVKVEFFELPIKQNFMPLRSESVNQKQRLQHITPATSGQSYAAIARQAVPSQFPIVVQSHPNFAIQVGLQAHHLPVPEPLPTTGSHCLPQPTTRLSTVPSFGHMLENTSLDQTEVYNMQFQQSDHLETNRKGSLPPESMLPESSPPESTPPESSPPESMLPESSPPESTPPESSPPESTPPESSPPESTPPESSPPESTPPENFPHEIVETHDAVTKDAVSNSLEKQTSEQEMGDNTSKASFMRSISSPANLENESEALPVDEMEYEEDQELTETIFNVVAQENVNEESQYQKNSDPSVLDNLCTVCGVLLRPEPLESSDNYTSDGQEEHSADLSDDTETYQFHLNSETHRKNFVTHKKFEEEVQQHYNPLKKELVDMLQKFKSVESVKPSLRLGRPIDDMKEELEKNEARVSILCDRRSWMTGVREVNEMSDRMDSLLRKIERQYKRIPPDCLQATSKLQQEKREDEEDDVEELDNEPNEQQASSKASFKTKKERERSRDRKKKAKKETVTK